MPAALHGVQQVPNTLAAAAAALWCGVPFDIVVHAVSEVTGSPLRMEVHHLPNGPVVIVDCYNANPASVEAALRSLAALGAGRRLALLGLMAELGGDTEAEHTRMAVLAAEHGIEVVGYQTGLYGPALVTGTDDAVACCRPSGRATRCWSKAAGCASRGGRDRVRCGASVAGDRRVASRTHVGGRTIEDDPPAELAVEGLGA